MATGLQRIVIGIVVVIVSVATIFALFVRKQRHRLVETEMRIRQVPLYVLNSCRVLMDATSTPNDGAVVKKQSEHHRRIRELCSVGVALIAHPASTNSLELIFVAHPYAFRVMAFAESAEGAGIEELIDGLWMSSSP